jgi:hypothetical protein
LRHKAIREQIIKRRNRIRSAFPQVRGRFFRIDFGAAGFKSRSVYQT